MLILFMKRKYLHTSKKRGIKMFTKKTKKKDMFYFGFVIERHANNNFLGVKS